MPPRCRVALGPRQTVGSNVPPRRATHLCLSFVLALSCILGAADAATDGAATCTGIFEGSAVVDLCPLNWPGPRMGRYKLWLVLFHAPWCGHCQEMRPGYIRLAQKLSSEPGVTVGAIDCSDREHHDLCRRHSIVGYPALKAILAGRVVESYDGARETEALKTWSLGVLRRRGGSAMCPAGRVDVDGDVVPLCGAHFPGSGSQHSWLIAYYGGVRDDGGFPGNLASAASDLGCASGRRRRAGLPGASCLSWQKQLRDLGEEYGLQLSMPRGAIPGTRKPLARVGAVCCDCKGVGQVVASGPLRLCGAIAQGPVLAWLERGGDTVRELVPAGRDAAAVMASPRRLVELSLEALGAYKPRGSPSAAATASAAAGSATPSPRRRRSLGGDAAGTARAAGAAEL